MSEAFGASPQLARRSPCIKAHPNTPNTFLSGPPQAERRILPANAPVPLRDKTLPRMAGVLKELILMKISLTKNSKLTELIILELIHC